MMMMYHYLLLLLSALLLMTKNTQMVIGQPGSLWLPLDYAFMQATYVTLHVWSNVVTAA